jgi:putative colanic acid biosynthesis acetyltransferase WcaF
MTVDTRANRAAKKWSAKELAGRAWWEASRGVLFAWTPRPLWGLRRFVLRLFGARIGRRVHMHPTVRIAIPWTLSIGDDAGIGDRVILYGLGPISIGARATISQGAHLCAGSHDWRDPAMPLIKPPIVIGEDAWICADAFIGPDVTVGNRAIVGARAVVTKNVDADLIVGGNPAREIKKRISKQSKPGTS